MTPYTKECSDLSSVKELLQENLALKVNIDELSTHDFYTFLQENFSIANRTPSDRKVAARIAKVAYYDEQGKLIYPGMQKVQCKYDERGRVLGFFADKAEMQWHFAFPVCFMGDDSLVALHCKESGDVETGTAIINMAQAYEDLSEDFRSELDELKVVHGYIPKGLYVLNEGEEVSKDLEDANRNATPEEMEQDLIQEVRGIRGICISPHCTKRIVGDDDGFILETLMNHIMDPKYYQNLTYRLNKNDVILFDQKILLHKRVGGNLDKRVLNRVEVFL